MDTWFRQIYGFQDIKDDEIIGVKSTSIKFKKNPKIIITTCYLIFSICLFLTGNIMDFDIFYFLFFIIILIHLFYYQINNLLVSSPDNCYKIFKSNNILGLMIFINLLIGKI